MDTKRTRSRSKLSKSVGVTVIDKVETQIYQYQAKYEHRGNYIRDTNVKVSQKNQILIKTKVNGM